MSDWTLCALLFFSVLLLLVVCAGVCVDSVNLWKLGRYDRSGCWFVVIGSIDWTPDTCSSNIMLQPTQRSLDYSLSCADSVRCENDPSLPADTDCVF